MLKSYLTEFNVKLNGFVELNFVQLEDMLGQHCWLSSIGHRAMQVP